MVHSAKLMLLVVILPFGSGLTKYATHAGARQSNNSQGVACDDNIWHVITDVVYYNPQNITVIAMTIENYIDQNFKGVQYALFIDQFSSSTYNNIHYYYKDGVPLQKLCNLITNVWSVSVVWYPYGTKDECVVALKTESELIEENLRNKAEESRAVQLPFKGKSKIKTNQSICYDSDLKDAILNAIRSYGPGDTTGVAKFISTSMIKKCSENSFFVLVSFGSTGFVYRRNGTENRFCLISVNLWTVSVVSHACLASLTLKPDTTSFSTPPQSIEPHKTVWYFYLIGGAILILIVIALAIFFIKRRKKNRHEQVRQMMENMKLATVTTGVTGNRYETSSVSGLKDDWEVSLKSIDIDYITVLGKGAFSIVHSGYLHGKAPVVNLFSSIALQQFADCNVAVKTVPQHSTDSDKAKFRDEIRLMKEIGYNVHLVSMLGCNCPIERPILLMELAKQDLLHWLAYNNVPATEDDTNLEKNLLSISWQVSNGMSYLSSKNFVHRDLAARNVLLNSEMKAMVSDFGLCRKLQFAEQVVTIPGGKLPLKWLALESLQDRQFSLKTDIWSYGVLLYEIFSLGQEPYSQTSGEALVTLLREGNRLMKPRLAEDHTYDLMKQCWHADPAKRPDFTIIQEYFVNLLEATVANYGYLDTNEEKISDF